MNLPVSLLLLMAGGLLIYTGIKNPPGGLFGVVGSLVNGKPLDGSEPGRWQGQLTRPSTGSTAKPPSVDDLITGGIR